MRYLYPNVPRCIKINVIYSHAPLDGRAQDAMGTSTKHGFACRIIADDPALVLRHHRDKLLFR